MKPFIDAVHEREFYDTVMRNVQYGELILIGYWNGPDQEEWPDPHRFVHRHWNRYKRRFILEYLKNGYLFGGQMGYSWCRFKCRKYRRYRRGNGSGELTDGKYIWPEGLAHYIEKHHVALPEEFFTNARNIIEEYFGTYIIFDRKYFKKNWKQIKKAILWMRDCFNHFDPCEIWHHYSVKKSWWRSKKDTTIKKREKDENLSGRIILTINNRVVKRMVARTLDMQSDRLFKLQNSLNVPVINRLFII